MAPVPTIRERAGAWATLVLSGVALWLPWLQRPFGDSDLNAGAYFGLFVRFFERFGFATLRGMPLSSHAGLTADPFADATPYVNHPPGVTWLAYACGTSEAAMRVPTLILWLVSAVCLFELLRTRFATGWSLGGALAYLCLPNNAVLCMVGPAVLGFGLLLLLATERMVSARGRAAVAWRVVQALATFGGVWMDWSFAFVCIALLPLARLRLRALIVPIVAGALAVLSIGGWFVWGLALYAQQPPGTDFVQLLKTNVLDRPPLAEFLPAGWKALALANTALAPLAALPGMVLLLRRDPWFASALLALAFLNPLTFAHHASSHFHFWGYLGPLLAASLAAYSTLRPAWLQALGALVLGAVIVAAVWTSIDNQRRNDTTLFRDVGAVVSRAAEGDGGRRYQVGHNFPRVFAYYTPALEVLVPFESRPSVIEGARQKHPVGVRYLYVKLPPEAMRYATDSEALRTYLAQFPRERVPALEREFWQIDDVSAPSRIEEAWLYTITR